MDFDFDTPLKLRGAHTTKYDGIVKSFGIDDPEMIPMWVADMDFAAAPPILAALQAEVDRGYFGYYTDPSPVNRVIADWYRDRHGWDVDPGCIRYTHGVVNAFGDVLACCSEPGDGVILFSPVYHAFFRQIAAMGRKAVESPLVLRDGVYHMDLDALGQSLTGREKILVLCSPHNPGGRLWSVEEIRAVAEFCAVHDLVLISDEIHMDLTFPGVAFTPAAVAAPEQLGRLVVLTAASKAFNIAGAETGMMLVPDPGFRARMDKVLLDRESSPSRFGMAMIRAAFGEGGDWSDAVRAYIAENYRLFAERMNALPGVSVMPMQATYLSWLDFSALGMTDKELLQRILGAKVVPSPGTQFGTGGEGHMRFNVALPRAKLLEAASRLEAAFSDVQ
ncbi:MAG: PatB family C-S lyase [Silicimonas sp.]|nr:PatB family C-S lyase [Silicimonas sp.]